MLSKIHLVCVTLWLGLVSFTDIIAVPTIFRNLNDAHLSGKVGMILFSKLNVIEVTLALIIVYTALKIIPGPRVLLSGILAIISMTQTFYITPQIKEFASMLDKATVADEKMQVFNFLHTAYVFLDWTKLFLLVVTFVIAFNRCKVELGEKCT